MLELAIANLVTDENSFDIPSVLGSWNFKRVSDYGRYLDEIKNGMCANTFVASIDAVDLKTKEGDFKAVCNEIIDICLTLSFLNANCVAVSGSTKQSDIQFFTFGDSFIRPRGIVGFPPFLAGPSIGRLFSNWLANSYPNYQSRKLRLLLSHWLSGLTCFTLEDIFLSTGVQMDQIKQLEGPNLYYYDGMLAASVRYSLVPLNRDYVAMRNDIVHEGVLSGTRFNGKSKAECAKVIADVLNWLDAYILAVLNIHVNVTGYSRWKGDDFFTSLPAISLS